MPADLHSAHPQTDDARAASAHPTGIRHRLARIPDLLRRDSVGGGLLVLAALAAIVWANSPASAAYTGLRDFEFGYEPWHLRLSLGGWASDGLLAIFFFLVGLELKTEITSGSLRRLRDALLPVGAAVGGVVVPALIYLLIVGGRPELVHGWAIPTATDIAFAVAVLALVASRLPAALRIFLLALAAVDDLLAIAIIAIAYTETISFPPLIVAGVLIVVFAVVTRLGGPLLAKRPGLSWVVLLPLGVVVWALVHASGIHSTVAGVLLGFAVPTAMGRGDTSSPNLAHIIEHHLRPLSSGFAVPVFAFFAAGVALGSPSDIAEALTSPLTIGIVCALVIGKPVGIVAATWALTRFTPARLDPSLRWPDLTGVGVLAGVGFTVSLLVAELSFGAGSPSHEQAKAAILFASVLAAGAGAAILGFRNSRVRVRTVADPEVALD